jgi:uncharacterized membrane protein
MALPAVLTAVAGALALLSTVTFVLSLVIIPFLVARLPRDYFTRLVHSSGQPKNLVKEILKNLLGLLLLAAGGAMLFLPGQGILTIVLALMLLSFPGKRPLMRHFLSWRRLQRALNWLRKKKGKEAFLWP